MKLTTGMLVLCLVCAPTVGHSQSEPPPKDEPKNLLAGCLVLVIGGYVIWKLWKLCGKIPAPPPANPPPPPPPTNPPPIIPTNPPPPRATAQFTGHDLDNAHPWDISALGIVDANTATPAIYSTMFSANLETKSSIEQPWHSTYAITGYLSDSGVFLACYSNSVNVLNTYLPKSLGITNYLDLLPLNEPSRMFRLRVPQ